MSIQTHGAFTELCNYWCFKKYRLTRSHSLVMPVTLLLINFLHLICIYSTNLTCNIVHDVFLYSVCSTSEKDWSQWNDIVLWAWLNDPFLSYTASLSVPPSGKFNSSKKSQIRYQWPLQKKCLGLINSASRQARGIIIAITLSICLCVDLVSTLSTFGVNVLITKHLVSTTSYTQEIYNHKNSTQKRRVMTSTCDCFLVASPCKPICWPSLTLT